MDELKIPQNIKPDEQVSYSHRRQLREINEFLDGLRRRDNAEDDDLRGDGVLQKGLHGSIIE